MRSLHHQFNFDNYSIENLASNEWPIGGLIGLWKNRIDVTARITGACLSERPASSFAGGAVKLHQSIVECWTGAGFPFLLAVVHLFTFLFILPVISAHFFFILGFYYDFLLLYFFFSSLKRVGSCACHIHSALHPAHNELLLFHPLARCHLFFLPSAKIVICSSPSRSLTGQTIELRNSWKNAFFLFEVIENYASAKSYGGQCLLKINDVRPAMTLNCS